MATDVTSRTDSSVATSERIFERDFNLAFTANLGIFGSCHVLLATVPLYVATIGGSESDVGLMMSVFAISALALRPFTGLISDRRGCKSLMVVGALISVIALVLYGIASSVPVLAIVRAIHGVGFAIFGTAASAYVARIVRPQRRGEAMGYFGISSTLPMAVGPALGLWLTGFGGYQTMFAVTAAIALVALVTSALVKDSPVLDAPLSAIRWRSLMLRSAIFPSLVMACGGLTYAAIVSFVPVFANKSGAGDAGLFFAVYALLLLVCRPPLGKLSDILGRPKIIAPCLALQAGALFTLAVTTTTWQLLLAACLMGIGFAGTQPTLMAYAVDRASPVERGAAMGTLMVFLDMGIGFGSLLWGFVAGGCGFTVLFLAAGCASVLGILILAVGRGFKRAYA